MGSHMKVPSRGLTDLCSIWATTAAGGEKILGTSGDEGSAKPSVIHMCLCDPRVMVI
jgi:hypothetical protein